MGFKLTDDDVREIRKMDLVRAVCVAKIFGVTIDCINAIRRGKTWSWLK